MGLPRLNLTGQRYGSLTALREVTKRPTCASRRWLCLCDCGNETAVDQHQLRSGCIASCGCAKRSAPSRPANPDIFWKNVRKSEGCWEWTAARQKKTAYGITMAGSRRDGSRRSMLAHRKAWEIASGQKLSPEAKVCHTCDNPACVRNDEPGSYEVASQTFPRYGHLFLADQAANVRDMEAKGRDNRPGGTFPHYQGSNHPRTKLTPEQAAEIRSRYRQGGVTQTALAEEFQVHQTVISKVIRREHWTSRL